MAEIVLGIGASHTTLMNTQWRKVDHLERAHHFRDALGQAHSQLDRARPDAAIIIGSNHFRGFWLDLMPAFTIGVDKVVSAGEHGTPEGELPAQPDLALQICEGLLARSFDIAFSANLHVDHGISHAFQWLVRDLQIPIVPIVINCFAPPLPTLARCEAFGAALGNVVRSLPGAQRIALIATGGLSHDIPFPDWRSPVTDDDQFLVDSWRDGRGDWKRFEERRRSIVVNHPPVINETFDRRFLELLRSNGLASFTTPQAERSLVREAGNGGNEIRAWLAMAAALNNCPGQILAYSPMPEWLTGMAVAVIDPRSKQRSVCDYLD